jgi:hypothetical protein
MRNFLLIAVLLSSVLFHSVASAHQRVKVHAGSDLAHAMMHWEGEAHHHHEDGSLHHDDSDASQDHLNAEAATSLAGLASADLFALPKVAPAAAVAYLSYPPLTPILEGLRRPPRLPA